MKKNKKLLVSFLALNAMASSYAPASGISSAKYDRMYNSIVKNMETSKSNEKTYQTIEKILKQKNKELKDLYLQNDYIVKPEYLEWQVFFAGFYDEYNEGRDNSSENALYHSKVTGYYDTTGSHIVTSGFKDGTAGKPYKELLTSCSSLADRRGAIPEKAAILISISASPPRGATEPGQSRSPGR